MFSLTIDTTASTSAASLGPWAPSIGTRMPWLCAKHAERPRHACATEPSVRRVRWKAYESPP
jgi:hypothetical protein